MSTSVEPGTEHEREDWKRAGVVTHEEAKDALIRFCNSHFGLKGPNVSKAIIHIPADPRYDDDIRLSAYIERCRRIEVAAAHVMERARENWGDDLPPEFCTLAAALSWPCVAVALADTDPAPKRGWRAWLTSG